MAGLIRRIQECIIIPSLINIEKTFNLHCLNLPIQEKVFMSDLPFLVKRDAYNGSISLNNEEDESETTDVQFGSPLEKYSPKYYRLLKIYSRIIVICVI